jgi:Ca2+:H+ antiporter
MTEKIGFKDSLKSFFLKKLNILLIILPFSFMAHFLSWGDVTTFILNFLVIVPLAKLLGHCTEDISLRTGAIVGGLLNATFGNAVELIISIAALQKGLLDVVKSSLIGSILSNLLFVLGLSFFFGGIYFSDQKFNYTASQTACALLSISVFAFLIPSVFDLVHFSGDDSNREVLILSRGTAVILIILYFFYLFFQLKTHRHLFDNEQATVLAEVTNDSPTASEQEEPTMDLSFAVISLICVTIVVAACAEFLVSAIEGVASKANLSHTFIGIILLPLVGNAAEHVTAITVAMKNKMDLSISIAIGSSLQISLFVLPLTTLIGWALGQKMSMDFHTFETVVLFMTVLTVNYIIQDGRSNWIEGAMLLAAFLILGTAFFLVPPKIHAPWDN